MRRVGLLAALVAGAGGCGTTAKLGPRATVTAWVVAQGRADFPGACELTARSTVARLGGPGGCVGYLSRRPFGQHPRVQADRVLDADSARPVANTFSLLATHPDGSTGYGLSVTVAKEHGGYRVVF